MIYKVKITYPEKNESEVVVLHTESIQFTMNQYSRNRDYMEWEVIESSSK